MDYVGFGIINVELTNKCNKNCWMCGTRKIDSENPELSPIYGDIDFSLLEKIAPQLPSGSVVQFHRDGEALLYPRFGEAAQLFSHCIRSVVTNGKLLVKKANEIIGNMDTLSISIFENDNEAAEQKEIIREFLSIKGNKPPFVTLRVIGEVDQAPYKEFKQLFVKRTLHAPLGTFNYTKKAPTIPEIGICWDFLQHPCISCNGDFSICMCFDPKGLGVLGNVHKTSIAELWNSKKRQEWKALHVSGKRSQVPLCENCEYWGVPI